mgnify:FL=1
MNSVQNIRAVSNLKDTYAYSYPDIWDLMENEQIAEFAKGNIAMINTYAIYMNLLFGILGFTIFILKPLCPLRPLW